MVLPQGGASLLEEEIHYLCVALSAQMFQQPLGSVGKETASHSSLCNWVRTDGHIRNKNVWRARKTPSQAQKSGLMNFLAQVVWRLILKTLR